MKSAKWVLINGLLGICLYFGYVEEVEGAKNIALFIAWLAIVSNILMFFIDSDKMVLQMKEEGRSVPSFISITYSLLVTGFLLWFGASVTGVFYFVKISIVEFWWGKIREIKEEQSENA